MGLRSGLAMSISVCSSMYLFRFSKSSFSHYLVTWISENFQTLWQREGMFSLLRVDCGVRRYRGAKENQKEANRQMKSKGSQKGATRESKRNQEEPKGARREPKGSQKGAKRDHRGPQKGTNRRQGYQMGAPRVQTLSPNWSQKTKTREGDKHIITKCRKVENQEKWKYSKVKMLIFIHFATKLITPKKVEKC